MNIISKNAIVATLAIGGMVAGALTASAALNLQPQNCSFVFNSNMKLGSRGADVKNLQTVLNMFPQTAVATSGVGSTGKESTTFGPATKAAVIKFQDLHLTDLGIAKGNGNVFALTRGLLNKVCSGGASTATTATTPAVTTGTTPSVTVSGPVSASLAATQPMGMIAAGQAGALLANLTFSGNGTITNLELQRIGVSFDSELTNVYLYDGNKRISDAASVVTGGFIRFNSSAVGLFSVNGTRTISVRADILAATQTNGVVGSAVGVKLNSVTTTGGTPTTYTNVMGPVLAVSGVSLATVNLGTVDTNGGLTRYTDAGTLNYNVWSDSVSIGTRDTILKAATFKYVGSAPVDSVQNLSLYVDGTKVAGPATVDSSNNNKVTFDLGATPFVLKSGSHTVDVRGDIVKGSSYNFYFSIENVADLMIEDSNLYGVAIAATINSATFSSSNATYATIGVNKGSVTVNVDPAFNPSTITGGSTNMPIAQFVLKGYGEDVKVNTLAVTPTVSGLAPYNGGLSNVGLFLNGGQIGTSQTWAYTGGALTYTTGSSLIIPAGQTVTLTVKADILNATNTTAYTAGTVTASIGGVPNNAQGVTSNQLVSVAGSVVLDQTISIGSGTGAFARTSGFVSTTIAPNSTGVKIGSFTLQAGSSEDSLVNQASVNLTYGGNPAMTSTNVSNLVLKTNGTVLGTPVGTVPTSGSSTFSFSDISLPMNTTKTFDVYADLGSATGTVYADMGLTVRGAVSRISSTVSALGSGATISPVTASLTASSLVASSPIAQYVIGGTSMGLATFKLKTSVGDATVKKLGWVVTGTDAVTKVTINGIDAAVVNGQATTTGLSIPVSTNGSDITANVTFSGFKNASVYPGSLTATTTVSLRLSYVEAQSGSGAVINDSTASINSNTMSLVASKPTITGMTGNGTLNAGKQLLGTFRVAADPNGAIAVATTSLIISTSTGGTLGVTSIMLSDDNGATPITNSNTVTNQLNGTAFQIGFTTPYQISAGQYKDFQVWGTVSGSFGAVGTSQVATSLDSTLSAFKWVDIVSSSTANQLTGTGIQNFPVTSYNLKN